MPILKEKDPKNKAVSVYLGEFESKKLKELMEFTGFNQSETVRRLIRNADINSVENIDDKVKRLTNGRLEVVKMQIPDEFKKEYENLTDDDVIGMGKIPKKKRPFNPVKAVKEVRLRKGEY